MSPLARVLAFLAVCAAVFAAALGLGRLIGPIGSERAADEHGMDDGAMGAVGAGPHHDVGGLEASAGGYTLSPLQTQLTPGHRPLQFTIVGPDGRPVTSYAEQHQRQLHLVVVRRDLTGYQHLHPTLDPASGQWSVPVDVTPGTWRMLADFVPSGGEELVLGADLMVAGEFAPEPLGADLLRAQTDGYDVSLTGDLEAGAETMLTATISRGGAPVADLQPYLGAYGHLVSLRDGDVGYLHVHPDEAARPGPEIAFHTEFPSPGRYRLFLDFRHGGRVHTAVFTVTVAGGHAH